MQQQYTDYDAIAFAEDPSFIRWVRHKEPIAKAFWKRWLKEHPEKKAIIQEAKVLVQSIQIKETEPSRKRIDSLWLKIDGAIEKETTKLQPTTSVTVRKLRPLKWLGYAAAAAVAALLVFQVYNPTTTVSTLRGTHLAHTLPDQSTVELNADSKISYQAKSWSSERIVELEGEAFFDVESGSSFKVITPNGTVEVLGTEFNVNTRNGELVVDCKEGKVCVSAKGDTEILTEGQGTRMNPQKTALIDTYSSKVGKKIGWRAGEYYMENVSLSEVITELERQYDVQIQGLDATLLKRSGDYTFNGDIKNALDDIFWQLSVKPNITIEDKKVMIQVNK